MSESYSILLAGLNTPEKLFISTHFSRLGHQIITVGKSADAQEKVGTQKFDLVYLQGSGEDKGLKELENLLSTFDAPAVVLLCAVEAEGFVLKAWHAGAADILCLPLATQSLDASLQRGVEQLLLRKSKQTAPQNQARLFYLDETGKEHWVSIIPPKFSIGRSSGNNLILSQMDISRFHAEVLLHEGKCQLCDLGSKHGTYLNGVRVEKALLKNGDRIQLGGFCGSSLTFHEGDLLQSLLASSDSKPEISLQVRGFKEVGMLFAALRAFSSMAVLDDLLALVVDTAIELTGAERGFIMLRESYEDLSFRCARNNHNRPLDGSDFQTSRRVPYDVFQTGRPVFIRDLDIDIQSEDHSATRKLGLRSISCVPLRYLTVHESGHSEISTAETIGVLYVDSSCAGAGLPKTSIDALESLASEAAMAIYNVRLYKDSQDKRKLDEQLTIAREIQQALLPQSNKELAYVRVCSQSIPCHEVGGDYFDYFDLSDERLGFAVGDVAGKGIPAALLASLIQGIFTAQNLGDLPLSQVIANANQNIVHRGTGNRFVTFFFGILDTEGNCTYVNAGHNPPFLLSRDGLMKELTTGGMVLGLFAGAQYEAETIRLHPGDHLVLFTDGVVEALNSLGEEFGIRRLTSVLGANASATSFEILARTLETVLAFSANTPQHDDITMMVLGFRE
jgi:phosphoserine phosphatase RsbU/P